MDRARYALGITVTCLGVSPCTLAQSGSMSYTPASPVSAAASAQAIPTIGALGLLALAVVLGLLGFWALRSGHAGRALGLLIAGLLSLAFVAGGLSVPDAGAPPALVFLDNPAGGTVPVPESFQEYNNNSGVALRIGAITDPCGSGAPNQAAAACMQDLVLADGDTCATEYMCPQAEVCDGIDNDLNTLVDDGLTPPIGLDCGGDTPVCNGASGWACPLVCTPDCAGKVCGSDGCSGSCGSCGGGASCSSDGTSCII